MKAFFASGRGKRTLVEASQAGCPPFWVFCDTSAALVSGRGVGGVRVGRLPRGVYPGWPTQGHLRRRAREARRSSHGDGCRVSEGLLLVELRSGYQSVPGLEVLLNTLLPRTSVSIYGCGDRLFLMSKMSSEGGRHSRAHSSIKRCSQPSLQLGRWSAVCRAEYDKGIHDEEGKVQRTTSVHLNFERCDFAECPWEGCSKPQCEKSSSFGSKVLERFLFVQRDTTE